MIINGYSQVQTQDYSGSRSLPAGAYCAVILKAEETTTQNGNPAVKVAFDIADGEYAGYYMDQYKRLRNKIGDTAKFGGTKIHVLSEKAIPFFKAFITAVEESNPGLKVADGDNVKLELLKSRKVGVVMRREEYQKNDGSTGWSTKQFYWTDVKKVIAGECETPDDKPLSAQKPAGSGFAAPAYSYSTYIPGAYTGSGATAASAPRFEEIDPDDPEIPF